MPYKLFICLTLITAFLSSAASAQDRFHPSRSYIDQLIALAEVNDLQPSDVSGALFDGRLAPDLDDLRQAYAELDNRSCDEVAVLSADKIAFEGKPCWFRKFYLAGANEAWNERFGVVPEEHVFWLSVRMGNFGDPDTGRPYKWAQSGLSREQIEKTRDYDKLLGFIEYNATLAAPHYFDVMSANNRRSDFASLYERNRRAFLVNGRKTDAQIAAAMEKAVSNTYEPDEIAMRDAYNAAVVGGGSLVRVKSIDKRSCTRLRHERNRVLCEVRPNPEISGPTNPLLEGMMRMAEGVERPFVFVVFENTDGVWRYIEGYQNCANNDGEWDCVNYR